jgi:hypothetical protein
MSPRQCTRRAGCPESARSRFVFRRILAPTMPYTRRCMGPGERGYSRDDQ